MPDLPEYQEEREIEIADKPQWERGVLTKSQNKPFVPRRPFRFPNKTIAGILVLVAILVCTYVAVLKFAPGLLSRVRNINQTVSAPFEYPVNAADIKFPTDSARNQFLAKLQAAAKEQDSAGRYKLLEDAFALIRGFYTASADPSYRPSLSAYKDYMQKNYPDQFAINSVLYNYPCLDKECGQVKDPDVILEIRKSVGRNAIIDKQVRETIIRDFDAAALNSDKDFAGNMYNAALTLISSEGIRTRDVQLAEDEAKLKGFMKANYPEIPIVENIVK